MYPVDTLSFCMCVTLRLGVENLLEHTYIIGVALWGSQKFHECPLIGETYTRNVKKDILIFNKKKDVII